MILLSKTTYKKRIVNKMLRTKPRFQTFEEYLEYDDNSEKLYELFNGELIETPPE